MADADVASASSCHTVAVLGAAGHGKTSLVEALIGAAISGGSVAAPSPAFTTRTRELSCVMGGNQQVKLLDAPGHADLTDDAATSLARCDSVLVALDATEGLLAATARLLAGRRCPSPVQGSRPAPPVLLALTNMDRILRCGAAEEDIYKSLAAAVHVALYQGPMVHDQGDHHHS